MNFKTLKYIVTVAEERSFTQAAHKLCVSQPSLSQNIQAYENKLGTPLFDRKTLPLTLTYAGKVFVEWANQVLLSESQMNRRLTGLRSDPRMRLAVGIAPHRSPFMIPPIVAAITREFETCTVAIEDNTHEEELYEKVADRDLDFMIGNAHPNTVRFTSQFVTHERMLLAVPKSFGIEGTQKDSDGGFPSLHISELRDKPFITLPSHSYLGSCLRTLCEQESFSPIYGIECHNVATAHAMASLELGATLVPELMVRLSGNHSNLDYFSLAKGAPHQSISIIHPSGAILTEPAKRFIELFMQAYHNITKN